MKRDNGDGSTDETTSEQGRLLQSLLELQQACHDLANVAANAQLRLEDYRAVIVALIGALNGSADVGARRAAVANLRRIDPKALEPAMIDQIIAVLERSTSSGWAPAVIAGGLHTGGGAEETNFPNEF